VKGDSSADRAERVRKNAALLAVVWASRKLVESLYIISREICFLRNPPLLSVRKPCRRHPVLIRQAAAQALVAELQQLVEEELREMVATLQQAEPATLFGATEFTMRDLALKIAAKAYQQRLDQKKTATKVPV